MCPQGSGPIIEVICENGIRYYIPIADWSCGLQGDTTALKSDDKLRFALLGLGMCLSPLTAHDALGLQEVINVFKVGGA